MTVESLVEEPLCHGEIAVLAEEGLNRIANAVDGAVEIHPLAPNLDVGFVHMPFAGDAAFAPVEALQQQRRIANDPTMDGRVTDSDTALSHHFFKIAQAQIVGKVPAYA